MSDTDPKVDENLTPEQLFSRMSVAITSHDHETVDRLAKVEPAEEPEEEVEVVESEPDATAPVETAADEVQPEPVAGTGEEAPSDWTAVLPKEAQEELARLKKIEMQARSEAGRVPYLQRKLAEMEKKLHATTQPSLTTPAAQPSGTTKDETAEELEKILAELGEVDPVTTKALSLIRKEAQRTAKKTENILVQKEEEAHLAREWNKLVEQIPQAPDVFKLPEWSLWKDEQSPRIKALASSSDADDVVMAMEKFAKDMAARNPDLVKTETPQAAPVVAAPSVPATPDPKEAAIAEQRSRRLAATTPTSAVAPKGDSEPKDPEALFRHFSAQVRKQYHLDKPKG
jgi:hypothetical protein